MLVIIIVTSLAEVWIETPVINIGIRLRSVTSLAEVWIETWLAHSVISYNIVTSLAEVWIETGNVMQYYVLPGSLPLRKCGLKQL